MELLYAQVTFNGNIDSNGGTSSKIIPTFYNPHPIFSSTHINMRGGLNFCLCSCCELCNEGICRENMQCETYWDLCF